MLQSIPEKESLEQSNTQRHSQHLPVTRNTYSNYSSRRNSNTTDLSAIQQGSKNPFVTFQNPRGSELVTASVSGHHQQLSSLKRTLEKLLQIMEKLPEQRSPRSSSSRQRRSSSAGAEGEVQRLVSKNGQSDVLKHLLLVFKKQVL